MWRGGDMNEEEGDKSRKNWPKSPRRVSSNLWPPWGPKLEQISMIPHNHSFCPQCARTMQTCEAKSTRRDLGRTLTIHSGSMRCFESQSRRVPLDPWDKDKGDQSRNVWRHARESTMSWSKFPNSSEALKCSLFLRQSEQPYLKLREVSQT